MCDTVIYQNVKINSNVVKFLIVLKWLKNFKDYKNLTIDIEMAPQKEGIVEEELKNIQERFVKFEDVKDRETTAKDVVLLDFEGFVDNEPLAGGAAKNYQLDLEHSNFIPGFAEALVGHKIGEEFEINVTFPENYHEEKIKGKPAVFKIKINEFIILSHNCTIFTIIFTNFSYQFHI